MFTKNEATSIRGKAALVTEIGNAAASAYGALRGISAADSMKRNWTVPLDANKVAAAIVGSLRGDIAQGVTAVEVTGQGVEPLG